MMEKMARFWFSASSSLIRRRGGGGGGGFISYFTLTKIVVSLSERHLLRRLIDIYCFVLRK